MEDQSGSVVNEVFASLDIYGHEDPSAISKSLGLKPDEIRRKGEIVRPGSSPLKQSVWVFKSKLSSAKTIEEHIDWLLKKLRPVSAQVSKMGQDYNTELSLGVYFYEVNPGISLDQKILSELGRLNLKLDLDMYCLKKRVLEEKAQINSLEAIVNKTKIIAPLNVDRHNEGKLLSEALSAIEKLSEEIYDSLIPDLFLYSSSLELEGGLKEVAVNIKRIDEAVKRSKYLSKTVRATRS